MSNVFDTLPDIQVFARDPEQLSEHELHIIIDRLKKHVARMRKARQDEAHVKQLSDKTRKTNAARRKKVTNFADPMDTIV